MTTEIKLPDLGEGVEDASISRWLVKEGDAVKSGDVILEVATDKVDTEVIAPVDGTILKLNAGEGEIVALDAVLAIVGAAGESVASKAADQPAAEPKPAPAAAKIEAAQPAVPATPSTNGEVKATPVAKRIAAEKGLCTPRLDTYLA